MIFQLLFRFLNTVLCEVFGVETQNLINLARDLLTVCEGLTVDHDRELLVEYIVFKLEEGFHELLLYPIIIICYVNMNSYLKRAM